MVILIGSNEKSWRIDVPFNRFDEIRPTPAGAFGQNGKKLIFSKHEKYENIQSPFEYVGLNKDKSFNIS